MLLFLIGGTYYSKSIWIADRTKVFFIFIYLIFFFFLPIVLAHYNTLFWKSDLWCLKGHCTSYVFFLPCQNALIFSGSQHVEDATKLLSSIFCITSMPTITPGTINATSLWPITREWAVPRWREQVQEFLSLFMKERNSRFVRPPLPNKPCLFLEVHTVKSKTWTKYSII